MKMNFLRKLPIPQEIKKLYPIDEKDALIKEQRQEEIKRIFEGKSDKFILKLEKLCIDSEIKKDNVEAHTRHKRKLFRHKGTGCMQKHIE